MQISMFDCGKHNGTKTDPKQLNFMEEINENNICKTFE